MGEFRAGLVAVVGRPNVGKSSLTNRLVGRKCTIVSDKPQTTRRRILGIVNRLDSQVVLADTPGIHAPKHRLGAALNATAYRSAEQVDAILFVVDVSHMPTKHDKAIASKLAERQAGIPLVLAMNKMDQLAADRVEAHYNAFLDLCSPDKEIMTAATKGHNIIELHNLLVETVPEGPALYPQEWSSDLEPQAWAEEIVREKILERTREEVPHAIAVYTEGFEVLAGTAKISLVVVVETEGQKAIVIGKGGRMLKEVGSAARKELEASFGCKVFMELFVKVSADWRQSSRQLRELGLE
ncbi:MAG: GTPase Era [Fimbriimonadaceae bacterium]|nr:GTPase Era [Fimbriimonadaceae bacterium]